MTVHRRDIDSSIGAEHPELLRLSRELIPIDVEVLDASDLFGFMVPAMYDEYFVTRPIELVNDGPTDETRTPEDDYSHCRESCRHTLHRFRCMAESVLKVVQGRE
jgi:hypothetical protein